LALAIELGIPAVTADRAWSKLDLPVEIRIIR
jgi:PIN domain nuclease of toxin-antitoxin system